MKFRVFSLILLTGCLLSSCAWFGKPKNTEGAPATGVVDKKQKPNAPGEITDPAGMPYYVVKADFTPLYRSGPQQANGPDQSLPKDTLVTLLNKGFGYSRVQLDTGLNGYVATEDLEPATADRVAPPAPAFSDNISNNSAIVEKYSVEKAASSAATSTSNAEALPELPEPRLEPEPTPVDKPDFRY